MEAVRHRRNGQDPPLTPASREAAKAATRLGPVRLRYEVAKSSADNFEKLLKQASATTPKEGEEGGSKAAGNKWDELFVWYVRRQRRLAESSMDMLLLEQDAATKYEREVWRVIIEIRKEIGFAVDEQVFLGVMQASVEEQQQSVDSVAAEIRQFLDDVQTKFTSGAPAKPAAAPENKPLEGS